MYPRTQKVVITTSTTANSTAAGGGVGYTTIDNGRVLSIQYASTTLGTTGSIAVTNGDTSEAIFTHAPAASTPTYYPRKAICDSTGGSIAYSTGGGDVLDYFFVSAQQVKITLTACTEAVAATFRVTIG